MAISARARVLAGLEHAAHAAILGAISEAGELVPGAIAETELCAAAVRGSPTRLHAHPTQAVLAPIVALGARCPFGDLAEAGRALGCPRAVARLALAVRRARFPDGQRRET